MKSRKSKSNVDVDTEDNATLGLTETDETEKDEGDNMEISTNESTSSTPVTPSTVTEEGNFTKPTPFTESGYRKRQKTSGGAAAVTITDVNRKALDSLEYFEKKEQMMEMKNSLHQNITSEPPDPDMAFFQSVLPDMQLMNDTQKRQFKIGILNLAQQILTPTYNYVVEQQ